MMHNALLRSPFTVLFALCQSNILPFVGKQWMSRRLMSLQISEMQMIPDRLNIDTSMGVLLLFASYPEGVSEMIILDMIQYQTIVIHNSAQLKTGSECVLDITSESFFR